MTKRKYTFEQLLSQFLKDEHYYANPHRSHPFIYSGDNKLWTTDNFGVLIANPTIVRYGKKYPVQDCGFNLPGDNDDIVISVNDLQETLKKVATLKKYEYMTCPECKGSKRVYALYTSSRSFGTWHIETDCPVCNGKGVVKAKPVKFSLVPDERCYINIKDVVFKAPYIQRIVNVCNLAGVKEIHWVHVHKENANIFNINKDIKVAQMPCDPSKSEHPERNTIALF